MNYVLAALLLAQINVPDRVDPHTPIIARCEIAVLPPGATVDVQFRWRTDQSTGARLVVDTGSPATAYIWAKPGTHSVQVTAIVQHYRDMVMWVPDPAFPNDITKAKPEKVRITESFRVDDYQKTFVVGEPTPPVPPVPPVPPDPTPQPGQISVLIVEETQKIGRGAYRQYLNILNSTRVRDYLNAHCAKGPDGKTPEWRLFDKDINLESESKKWKDAMSLKRAPSAPLDGPIPKDGDGDFWIVISNGAAGYSGPLPQNEDELLTLLKKWGGA